VSSPSPHPAVVTHRCSLRSLPTPRAAPPSSSSLPALAPACDVVQKIFGSKHAVWSWVIGLYIPWFVITTLYLIDPRLEQWSVAMVTKIYHRAQELRHREGLEGVKEAMAKWWKWRKEYKPPRVGNV